MIDITSLLSSLQLVIIDSMVLVHRDLFGYRVMCNSFHRCFRVLVQAVQDTQYIDGREAYYHGFLKVYLFQIHHLGLPVNESVKQWN